MIETKLILIDGIAGSGKSTISQRLYRTIHLNGHPVEFYHEFYRPHPVLQVEAETVSGWAGRSLEKWRQFVHHRSAQDAIAIMDGAVFQCGVGELLEQDADDQTITDYVHAVAEIIKPLGAAMINLYQRDLDAALTEVYTQRPRAWRNRVETQFSNSAYGRNRSLRGFDVYLDFNRSLHRLSESLFLDFNPPKLAFDNSNRQWDIHFDRICRFLKLPPVVDPFQPDDYRGEYIENEQNQRCRIAVVDGMLRVEGLFKIIKGLLPKREDTLFVQTWPDELTFTKDKAGRVATFHSTGPWNRIGDGTWTRTAPGGDEG